MAQPATGATPAASAAPPNTAAALHRLFAAKRSNRNKVLAGALLGGGAIVGLTVAANSGPGPEVYNALGAIAAGILIIPAALVGELLYYNSNYSCRHEQLAINDWRAHRLSPNLRRRLTPTYFEPDAPRRP